MKKSKTTMIQCKAMTGPPTVLRCGYFGAVAALMLLMTAGAARGQPSEVTELHASDAAAGDNFGSSVSIGGDTAIVGAPLNNDAGTWSGSAYIFQQDWGDPDSWGEVQELHADDAATLDIFGWSVSISGDVAIVGAPWNDHSELNKPGAAYLFIPSVGQPGQWEQVAKLTASDPGQFDALGWSVSISGDFAIVGAPGAAGDTGAAYIFSPNVGQSGQWDQVAKLTASDGALAHKFGWSVSISGDTALVGATGDDDNGISTGSAYVFVEPPGGGVDMTQTAKLTASDGTAFDFFGHSVAISIDTAVVGALEDDDDGTASGSAYVFVEPTGGWADMTQTAKLTAFAAAAGDEFGVSVSIRGEGVVVGAHQDGNDGTGAAYLFREPSEGWQDATENDKITASDAAADDRFGSAVSISGDFGVVGAHLNDDNGSASGSAYVFDGMCPCPWDLDGNGEVGIGDLLILLAEWGDPYGIPELLDLLAAWGPCPCEPGPGPPTLEEELADACLTQQNWDDFVDKLDDPNASQEDKDRYICWMTHYLDHCNKCTCEHLPECPSPDPFSST